MGMFRPVKKLPKGQAPGVDEICREILIDLDIVALYGLTRLYGALWNRACGVACGCWSAFL